MLSTRKFLAFSLPVGLLAMVMLGSSRAVPVEAATRANNGSAQSPAQLRLTALDTLMKGDRNSALDLYEEAIDLAAAQFGNDSTFLGDLYYEAGRLYLDLAQFNKAEVCLNQAVKINPKNASARLALAKLLETREKVQDSIAQIREALLINPSSPVARQRFIHTLSRYGQSPSDKAIATQESVTLASMQKIAREALLKTTADEKKSDAKKAASEASAAAKKATAAKAPAVPILPKNLAPVKEDEAKAEASQKDAGVTKFDTKLSPLTKAPQAAEIKTETAEPSAPSHQGESVTKPRKKPTPSLSLFPLQNLSERKKQDEQTRESDAKAKKNAEEAARKNAAASNANDVIEKLKEQARREAAQKANRDAAREASKESTEKAAKTKAHKAEKAEKTEKAAAHAPSKTKEKEAPVRETAREQAPVQQAPVQQMPMQVPQPYMQPFQPPVFTPAPKSKHGAGFVPPPPPTMPMYGGMPVQVIPQVIPVQAPKPPVKKVEKPKAPPKEESKPVEEAPPPMTSTGSDDPSFLVDWADIKDKSKAKKKGK
ncbi:MAG: tetratricopeptide repeat protein [Cyanobacteria bacterium REEB67]|nr:tetratricopeptide repeat protein [Cyanobacteria bacterium REEB67]